jgi:hypothetical protein
VPSENRTGDWVDRQYHPDGKLSKEIHYRGEAPHGLWREWHANGVLAKECEYQAGRPMNTTIRTWTASGVLVSENTFVNGQANGRASVFDERGKLVFRCYMLDGSATTRERYDKACESRPELPKYSEQDPPGTWGRRTARSPRLLKVEPQPLGPDFSAEGAEGVVASLLRTPKAEAWTWLNERNDRTLGEMTFEESAEYVAKAYSAGALRVIAVGLDAEGLSTNHLVIEVPEDEQDRAKVFRFERAQARRGGFQGEEDIGQRFLFLKLC